MTRPITSTLVAVALLPSFARADDGPNPERIFSACVEHLTEVSERCTARNAKLVQECLPVIRRLLADGQRERARAVARRCVTAINENTDECVEHVHARCRRCVRALLDLDATELARRLVTGCRRVVDQLRQNERRAVNAITSAFD